MPYIFLILFVYQSQLISLMEESDAEEVEQMLVYAEDEGVVEEFLTERKKEEGERRKGEGERSKLGVGVWEGVRVRSVGYGKVVQGKDSVESDWRWRIRTNGYSHWEARFLADQDHESGGFLIRPGGLIKQALFGDYQVNMGFGAVIGSAPEFSLMLGDPAILSRPGRGIRLHSGSDPERFLRGVAISGGRGPWSLNVLYSGRAIVSSQDTVPVEVAGACASWQSSKWEAGINLVSVIQDSKLPGRVDWSQVTGNDLGRVIRTGAWTQMRTPVGILLGEAGFSANGGMAAVAGFRLFELNGFSSSIRFSTVTPDYPVYLTRFQSGQSQVASRTRIEASARYNFRRSLTWFGTVRYESDASPADSKFIAPTTRLSQRLEWLFPGCSLSGCLNASFGSLEGGMPEDVVFKFKVGSDSQSATGFRVSGTLQISFKNPASSPLCGTALRLSAAWTDPASPIRLALGLHLFSMDPSAEPLYNYEPDLLYGFSAPVLTGSGSRIYATVKWKITHSLTLEAKVYQVNYQDYKHITEGTANGWGGKVQVVWGV